MSVEAGSRVDEEDRGGAGGPTVPALPDNEFLTSRDFLVQPLICSPDDEIFVDIQSFGF